MTDEFYRIVFFKKNALQLERSIKHRYYIFDVFTSIEIIIPSLIKSLNFTC